jgi:hypothetical protein
MVPAEAEAVQRSVKTIAVFDDFCNANDPHEEHDFGAFEAEGQKIFFKIDYLDRELSMHSPDPADPAVTQRVITIMLAEEYSQHDFTKRQNFFWTPVRRIWIDKGTIDTGA